MSQHSKSFQIPTRKRDPGKKHSKIQDSPDDVLRKRCGTKKLSEMYTIGDELGRGGFSIVKKGVRKETGETFAVKIIEKTAGNEALRLLYREIDIMKKLKHKNIISLEEVYDEPNRIYLVMELVTGGELFDQIVSRGTYGEHDAANIVHQILSAVEYMHGNGIAHRDLKPENCISTVFHLPEKKGYSHVTWANFLIFLSFWV
eukprot:TRINITY_DN1277_c0_g2_i3.p1 TRINITY_DN1277_c0_g2~~TRINITY_DN1277_c0_g2_i3.p1  ORF type:complete len:202 (+),score=37.80 TRINITY_DN1277_c0_g2_i3:187-792(+)